MTFPSYLELKNEIIKCVSYNMFTIILKYTIPKCKNFNCNDYAFNYECCSLDCAFACSYYNY